ncbi:SMI1/KNR4 family protein [Corallococcus sp. AB004]|uniref:SMI1/KNR4 family protein n=1 Tax=Corallococcus exiguus TaxID=83462 RepID=UPI000EA2B92C|nr:SMI1/KNR4 family protein [Corallococcus exiguus]NRD49017.1 SMI1/KNR4 family protein [Corallococcus exiguus]RKI35531.1 SMI1/KNR4 family protein [Corallococcus sp. AB004]
MHMDNLLAEFFRNHHPNPPASPQQIAAFEARMGWQLDAEMRAFYLRSNGGGLFAPMPNPKYGILPLDEIQRARVAIRGRDQESAGPASHFTLVDMQDTDFVIVDVAKRENDRYPLLDAFHETYPDETPLIASSFGEFFEKALRSQGRTFWLGG